ncbi:LPXTG cell wall anchor domain-containing protein [Lentzea flaviverrucosa]|uniref:LPXTG cell wall anchor domain-containing protein n=1 Tax=Lentzea flaviverrucosa TaxID=200379 RepID=UPI000B7F1C4C|nr:LPXTG cell wall anchor domain-containing protein [Lentzea flaviverrucosa]
MDPAAPRQELPDLQLTVWFGKPSYLGHETVTVHARVTNVGAVAEERAVITSTGDLSSHHWGRFSSPGEGVEPGQTTETSATGTVTTVDDVLRLVVTVHPAGAGQDANPADNTVSVSVPITFILGNFRGTFYGDRNGNHVMDSGEQLAGVRVHTSGGTPFTRRETVTGSAGGFEFTGLPVGTYGLGFPDSGWYVAPPNVEVDGIAVPDVLVRGTPRVDASLRASLAFERQAYQVGDVAHSVMSLTNTGELPLFELTAECSVNWDSGPSAVDTGPLTPGGPGVTLPAGHTQTFDIAVRVTENAYAVGYLQVDCETGSPPRVNGSVRTTAATRVPGGVAIRVEGALLLFKSKPLLGLPSGTSLPGVKVYLRDELSGAVVARAVTDMSSRFNFYDVPAGRYRLGVVGPWVIVWGGSVLARAGQNGPPPNYQDLHFVLPGPYQPDPDAEPPSGGEPAPPPGEEVLAQTGADVAWLALGGLLSLVTGAALVRRTRPARRR